MIDVEATQRAREAPAKTLEELADRLYGLIGRTLKLNVARVPGTNYSGGSNGYTTSGVLGAVCLPENSKSIMVRFSAHSNEETLNLKLTSEVNILADGTWTPIHRPEDGDQR